MDKPRYKHHRLRDTFLGQLREFDVYLQTDGILFLRSPKKLISGHKDSPVQLIREAKQLIK